MRDFLIFCFFLSFALSIRAQKNITDSVYVFHKIDISANRTLFYKKASKTQTLDSVISDFQNLNLADFLSRKTPVFIKNYGSGALATASFRGTSASHTAIIWNGINLQSAMNGTFDLSLVPSFLLDNVELNYGGESALFGSGAIGGTVQLYSQPKYAENVEVQSYSSYNTLRDRLNGIKVNFSNKKVYTTIKLLNQENKNKYHFANYTKFGSPIEIQQNAKIQVNALLIENYFLLPKQQQLSIKAWYQNNNRLIPPIISSTIGAAVQVDNNLRVITEWIKWWSKTKLAIRMANLSEALNYEDSVFFIASKSKANTTVLETELKHEMVKNHFIEFGTNISYIIGKSNGYGQNSPIISKQALLLAYKGELTPRLSGTLAFRQEFFNTQRVPLTFFGSTSYQFKDKWHLFLKVSKNYRLPTFNDLYWQPGGNIYLKPETGFCEEIGVNYVWKKQHKKLRIENTLYNKNINNWIIWLPDFGYWTPQNILQVWSRGYEAAVEGNFTIAKILCVIDARYNYTLATNQKTTFISDASLNKQLIYVPIYNAQSSVALLYKKIKLSYNHVYTYYRYTSSDNLSYLDPYHLANVLVAYTTKFAENFYINIGAQINNLLNTQYEVIAGRPMPLRFYQLSILINYTKNRAK